MKKKLLLLSFMAGPLLVYSADQEKEIAPPVQTKIKIAEPRQIMDEEEDEEESNQVHVVVEKKAEFPGGNKKLMEYLRENIKYPEQALAKSIVGRVFVKFTIKKDGSIDDIKVIRSADPLLDEEAIRVVKNMPNWIPAQMRGKDVRSTYIPNSIPMVFRSIAAPLIPRATGRCGRQQLLARTLTSFVSPILSGSMSTRHLPECPFPTGTLLTAMAV